MQLTRTIERYFQPSWRHTWQKFMVHYGCYQSKLDSCQDNHGRNWGQMQKVEYHSVKLQYFTYLKNESLSRVESLGLSMGSKFKNSLSILSLKASVISPERVRDPNFVLGQHVRTDDDINFPKKIKNSCYYILKGEII